ncbi:RabGAP/TBC [Hypoxylon sp. EC38]|nr:RabGAP/TBC [Hypoxylon sp. EC38]
MARTLTMADNRDNSATATIPEIQQRQRILEDARDDRSTRVPPPNSPLSPRWDSLGYDRAAALSPTSPVVSSHSRSSNATDELHLGVNSLSPTRDEFPLFPPTKKINATETVRVDNFSRPRNASIKSPYHEPPRPRPTNYSQTEPTHLDITSDHPMSWTRERGHSISSNMSAATFSSVPGRPPPDLYSREPLRGRGRQPGHPPSRPPVSYIRAESSGPAFTRDPIPRMVSLPSDELRSSYRSQLSASTAQGTVATERSSVATKSSSITSVYGAIDDGLSVDDVMGMYEKGFYDDSAPDEENNDADSRPPTAKSELSRRKTAMLEAMTDLLPMAEASETSSPSSPIARDSAAILDDPDMRESLLEEPIEVSSVEPEETEETEDPEKTEEISEDNHVDHDVDRDAVESEGEDDFIPPLVSRHPTEATIPEDDDERDRYGFRKSNQYVSREQYDNWNEGYTEYLARRRRKWTAFLREHGLMTDKPNRFPPRSSKTKRFVRKGIPPDWRGAAWFYYAGGPAVVAKHAGMYDNLLKQKAKDVDVEAIERDLHRTFPDNVKFRSSQSPTASGDNNQQTPKADGSDRAVSEKPMIASLRRVLRAFAIYNPRIGYCQSLNFLAGLLLLFVETEEQAFWLLNIITRVYLPGTHETSLEGANVDLGVLMSSLREAMPNVWAKIGGELDGTDVVWTKSWKHRHKPESTRLPPITLCMTAWFMSCFIGTLPIESVLRVWDVFFYEGSKTLFRIALAIFKIGEGEIRAVGDPMEIFQVVQTIPRRLFDANSLIEACFKRRNGFGHLSQETVDQKRQERRNQVKAEREKLANHSNSADTDSDVKRKATLFGRRREREQTPVEFMS